jgi:hypothetical protein
MLLFRGGGERPLSALGPRRKRRDPAYQRYGGQREGSPPVNSSSEGVLHYVSQARNIPQPPKPSPCKVCYENLLPTCTNCNKIGCGQSLPWSATMTQIGSRHETGVDRPICSACNDVSEISRVGQSILDGWSRRDSKNSLRPHRRATRVCERSEVLAVRDRRGAEPHGPSPDRIVRLSRCALVVGLSMIAGTVSALLVFQRL